MDLRDMFNEMQDHVIEKEKTVIYNKRVAQIISVKGWCV
jgi:hypothetical protein